uniref:Transposable element Tc3 transposase-like DNA-binding HTH domain-containing protein n=1 Tax=Caenorhabditis japonica TaxID=281687 RepID=A0A8R1ED74_CAEJA
MLQLKLGIENIAPHLTAALNQVLTNGRTPEDWKTVKISLLPKTTKPKNLKNYRPVALFSIVSKLFTKILTRRITAKSEDYLEESQAGLRRGRGCADNIQVVAQISIRPYLNNLLYYGKKKSTGRPTKVTSRDERNIIRVVSNSPKSLNDVQHSEKSYEEKIPVGASRNSVLAQQQCGVELGP